MEEATDLSDVISEYYPSKLPECCLRYSGYFEEYMIEELDHNVVTLPLKPAKLVNICSSRHDSRLV